MHPRPEYPRPQFRRERWQNLNGCWRFAFDFGLSGEERGWPADPRGLDREIIVPYCPESRLSGVAHTDFIPSCWYSRTFDLPADWDGGRILIHFGGVDYDCRAWINGRPVGRHYGGGASFTFEITDTLQPGENLLVVCAQDDLRSGVQPAGKQSPELCSRGCHYTRTTGIWQTAWLEVVPAVSLHSVRVVPDLDGSRFILTPSLSQDIRDHTLRAVLVDREAEIAAAEAPALNGGAFAIRLDNGRRWSPGDPYLYELRFELLHEGEIVDTVHSYAGLRKFHIEGNRFYLNNEPFFLRFVLDQGFYPDGIWTAPTDDDLKRDIELALAAGFNGARLHQKVFEERYHYWADRLGYLTWGEFHDWGLDFRQPRAIHHQQREWADVVVRDRNHPSIVAWTPFNESAGPAREAPEAHRQGVEETYALTKRLDPTRPINDTSGYVHVRTDIYSAHDYEQDADKLATKLADLAPDNPDSYRNIPDLAVPYAGQPYVVDEYGGTWWSESEAEKLKKQDGALKDSWGYGNRPHDVDEVYRRIEALTAVLTDHPNISGFTYTQLTDVEQEQNGIYQYDRTPKFDAAKLREYFGRPAAIETANR